MADEKKQPIRLTQQRAEALLAVFAAGAAVIESKLRKDLKFVALSSAEEVAVLKRRDTQLAAAKDAAAIVRHRYLHGDEPTEPTPTLF